MVYAYKFSVRKSKVMRLGRIKKGDRREGKRKYALSGHMLRALSRETTRWCGSDFQV